MDNNALWNILENHLGNEVMIQAYEDADGNTVSITLEDVDTGSVILDAEIYTLAARTDI